MVVYLDCPLFTYKPTTHKDHHLTVESSANTLTNSHLFSLLALTGFVKTISLSSRMSLLLTPPPPFPSYQQPADDVTNGEKGGEETTEFAKLFMRLRRLFGLVRH